MAIEGTHTSDPTQRKTQARVAALAFILFTAGTALSACGTTKPTAEGTTPAGTAEPQAKQESSAAEIAAARTSNKSYRTTPLRALWQHPPYFHDGSAATLADVVAQYNGFVNSISPPSNS